MASSRRGVVENHGAITLSLPGWDGTVPSSEVVETREKRNLAPRAWPPVEWLELDLQAH